jgi:hypothetical protein
MSAPLVRARRNAVVPATKAEAALWWQRFGLDPIPVKDGMASTALVRWLLERKRSRVHDWWLEKPDDNVGALLDDHVLVLIADTPEALNALRIIECALDKEPNQIHTTPAGEHHFFRRAAGTRAVMDTHSSIRFPERISVRTGQDDHCCRSLVILPPSDGFGVKRGEASSIKHLVEVDQTFVDTIALHNGRQKPGDGYFWPEDTTSDDSYKTLACLINHLHPRNQAELLRAVVAVHGATGGSEKGFRLISYWKVHLPFWPVCPNWSTCGGLFHDRNPLG